MLRFQIALAIILVSCIAILSCGRAQEMLEDPVTEMPMEMEMPMDMMDAYKSWEHVTLPAPMMSKDDAVAAMDWPGTGAAHVGLTPRTAYFNEKGAAANKAIANKEETTYPVGTMIVKEVMSASDGTTEPFVQQVVTMMKTDDSTYADNNYWIYGVAGRASAAEELMAPQSLPITHRGCHDCHSKATNDSVFVSLTMAEGDMAEGDIAEGDMAEGDMAEGDMAEGDMAEGDMAEGDTAEGDMAEGDMTEGDMAEGDMAEGDGNGNGDGNGADGNGNGAGNGNGNGGTQ